MESTDYQLIDDLELIQSYPQNYAREVMYLLRRLQYLKMHKSNVADYDLSAVSDVNTFQKFIFELLYAHDLDIEEFLLIARPNHQLVLIKGDEDES